MNVSMAFIIFKPFICYLSFAFLLCLQDSGLALLFSIAIWHEQTLGQNYKAHAHSRPKGLPLSEVPLIYGSSP